MPRLCAQRTFLFSGLVAGFALARRLPSLGHWLLHHEAASASVGCLEPLVLLADGAFPVTRRLGIFFPSRFFTTRFGWHISSLRWSWRICGAGTQPRGQYGIAGEPMQEILATVTLCGRRA